MSKQIGLITPVSGNQFKFNMAYYDFAASFGEVKLINPYEAKRGNLDLLILPGGEDVCPWRYNQYPDPECGLPNYQYEHFDGATLPEYIDDTPILGICRGFQTLNVLFGGDLYQHLPREPYSTESRGHLVHGVKDENDKFLFEVNSLHHQGIFNLAECLNTTLVSNHKDGCIEGFKHKELPIIGFQFHPEEMAYNNKAQKGNEWIQKEVWSIIK